MDSFLKNIQEIVNAGTQKEQGMLQTGQNVFIIGQQKSGKSTLANALSDQSHLFFKKNGNQFNPINKHYFPISIQLDDGTKQPSFIQIPNYQIWDFPGYGEGDAEADVENRLQQVVTINQSQLSHIILVFPYSQFNQDRGQNMIQVLNLLAQKGLPASIIVSKVPPKQILLNILQNLEVQLSQPQIIYTDEAKDLLREIIQNNRIQLFHQPQKIDDNQQFKQENINQLKIWCLIRKNFKRQSYSTNFFQINKYKQWTLFHKQRERSNDMNQRVIGSTIKNNITKMQNQQLNQIGGYELENQRLIKEKNKLVDNFKLLNQLIEENLENDIVDRQISKINDFFYKKDIKILQNQLYVCCASCNLSDIVEIYEKNQNISEIFIYAYHQFVIDCSIEMPSVQIYIKCKKFNVKSYYHINLKGRTGKAIQEKARNGDETNIHGEIGQNGNQGEPGGIFFVDAQEYMSAEKLTIDVSGGDGGDGQDGGSGLDGEKGIDGDLEEIEQRLEKCLVHYDQEEDIYERVVWCYFLYVSLGSAGTMGGNAGSGGLGGSKGKVGQVEFLNLKLPATNIVDQNSKAGTKGKDGISGRGGQNGIICKGVYQSYILIDHELNVYQIKDQLFEEKKIIACILLPTYALGYFGAMGIRSLIYKAKAQKEKGWKLKEKCYQDISFAPNGIVQCQNSLQQDITQGSDQSYQKIISLELFQKMQNFKQNEIVGSFKELMLSDEQIKYIVFGVNEQIL